jgi:hypothetical protein
MHWRGSLGVLGATLASALGCGASEEAPLDGSEPPGSNDHRVVLGTGEAEFEPMDGEPRLRLAAGVQGGFHVWASFLTHGFTSDRVDMELETMVEDDAATRLVMRARLTLRDTLDADGQPAQSFPGFPAQVYDARCAQDKRVSVAVVLTDVDGASASDERRCIAELDAAQRRDDCEAPATER